MKVLGDQTLFGDGDGGGDGGGRGRGGEEVGCDLLCNYY